jgi:hypothetical protein
MKIENIVNALIIDSITGFICWLITRALQQKASFSETDRIAWGKTRSKGKLYFLLRILVMSQIAALLIEFILVLSGKSFHFENLITKLMTYFMIFSGIGIATWSTTELKYFGKTPHQEKGNTNLNE